MEAQLDLFAQSVQPSAPSCWCCSSVIWRLGRFHEAALALQKSDSSLDHTNALRVAKFREGTSLRGEVWLEGAADFAHPESDFALRSLEAVMASAMLFKRCRVELDGLVNFGGDRRCVALVNGKRCVFTAEHAAFGGKCSDKARQS